MAKRVKVDEEVMTEGEFNSRLDVAHWGGRFGALEDAANAADTKSGQCYAARLEDKARLWREFADWLRNRAASDVQTYENLKDAVADDERK
jgi:hypothetical protein